MLPATLQFLIVIIASSINERMQKQLDYKSEEVLVLKEILRSVTGKSRVDFNESQRKRVAIKGKELSPKEREECCELVRPSTIVEWFRRIYAAKYDSSKSRRRPGRPRKPEETRRLVLAIANDNLSWGYTKIRDAVNVGLGIDICRSTVANILNAAGIVPAPERDKRRTWKEFMHSHWDSLYACDFFAVETLGVFGAVRHMVFFVVKLETREVHIVGIRMNPDGAWMKQVARNLTDPIDGFLRNATHLIHDADPLFTADFKAILRPAKYADAEGVTCVKIPPGVPTAILTQSASSKQSSTNASGTSSSLDSAISDTSSPNTWLTITASDSTRASAARSSGPLPPTIIPGMAQSDVGQDSEACSTSTTVKRRSEDLRHIGHYALSANVTSAGSPVVPSVICPVS